MYEKFREANALAEISKSLNAIHNAKVDDNETNKGTELPGDGELTMHKSETQNEESSHVEQKFDDQEEGRDGPENINDWYLRQIESNFMQEIEALGGQDGNVTSGALLKALTSQVALLDPEERNVALSTGDPSTKERE